MQPGYYRDVPIRAYHDGPGVSKSTLDLVHRAPALVQWSRNAPRDEETTAAADLGDAFHAVILEPHRFPEQYGIGPDVNRSTNYGKAAWQDFRENLGNRHGLSAEQGRQLDLMRRSCMAHPYARQLLTAPGDVEASIYWTDPRTGLLCRCRPDKLVPSARAIVDVKTTADMERFAASIHDYRYYVQDPFYSDGYAEHFGEPPLAFVFVAVSTTRDAGRYPVRTFILEPEDREQGRIEYREDLDTYAECERTGRWPGIEPITRPAWAKR